MNASDCITPFHLGRQALVYVRQSSPQQTLTNQESLKLQYALRQRAQEHGWMSTAIEVIDADLGRTGSTTEGRPGFKDLVARVTLGQVGIIFAYDVTRLARNCTDWYQLLDLCGYRHCLVGDQDGVYDPATTNGRLILGLKGLISELELHTIRARLTAGILSKAQRGELALQLPVGLVRDPLERVLKHPDQEVQGRIDLVFATFLRLGPSLKSCAVSTTKSCSSRVRTASATSTGGRRRSLPSTPCCTTRPMQAHSPMAVPGPRRSRVPRGSQCSNGYPWTSGRSASATSTRPISTGTRRRESWP
jgi:DNA invertase Pin-like site-specific DNA recombinase